jgi:RHS repeat-associated protein
MCRSEKHREALYNRPVTTPVDQIETVLIPAGAFTMGDGSGNVTASYGYDVFGAVRSGAPGATDRLFTGEQRDADSEMYYLRARYYDPSIGRFLGRDPLPGGNLYAYVGNNPVNFTDPSGLCPRRYLLRPRPIQVYLRSAVTRYERDRANSARVG